MIRYALCLIVTLFALVSAVDGAVKAVRPNILFFYVDDMGWGAIGPNGQAERRARNLPSVRTPHLDRLAARGVNFTRGYGCTVCSPARSSLQTGFHQGHTFADRNDPNNAKKAIRADDLSIGTALSSAGYVTGYWGKWGYGGSKDHRDPVIENVQTLPTSHGYKHVLAELHHVRAHTFFQPTLWSAPVQTDATGGLELIPNTLASYQNKEAWPATPALQNHPDYPKTAYCDDAYAFAALDFVRRQGQNYNESGQPFFGLLAVQIPHAPFGEITTLPEWDKAYSDDPHFESLSDQTRHWAAMVTRIDSHFGNLLAALEDPDNDGDSSDSIAGNTLVVFQSDNGGPAGRNNAEFDANGGLSGHKGRIQEGGIRVPLVMSWPAQISSDTKLKAGTDCDRIVDVSDLLPTFCELAGAHVPLGIDGVSIAPTLLGTDGQRKREFIIHEAGNGQSIIRGNYKLVRTKRSLELFDLDADHAEAHNIAAKTPRLVEELENLLLGERVSEPRGFANTYHRWTGPNMGMTSDPDFWSDYKYANAGITYMADSGPPRSSWIARIENTGRALKTVLVNTDLNVLALEARGNSGSNAQQVLQLGRQVDLTGRNGIRLASHATLAVDGGTVSSLRWLDIDLGATLRGHGAINATVYNNGKVDVTGAGQRTIRVIGNYHQSASGMLNVTTSPGELSLLRVQGEASLAGQLSVIVSEGTQARPGQPLVALKADRIMGRFINNEVNASDGSRFTIGYSESAVTLTRK